MNSPAPGLAMRWTAHVTWALVAIVFFHLAHSIGTGWLLLPCACALIEMSRASTRRLVFCPMLGVGFLFYAPQLGFFWGIFGPPAVALWLVLAFWIGLFGLLLRQVRLRFGNGWMLALAPFLWTGLEYFRSELYYLRFGWLTFGMAGFGPGLAALGVFGGGFAIMAAAAALHALRNWKPGFAVALLVLGLVATGALWFPTAANDGIGDGLAVAGVQLEFPDEEQVLAGLDRAREKFPEAQLFLLSEYTFQTPPPPSVLAWCASHRVHLVVGGKEPLGSTNFHNMAYVIGTNGAVVHQQAKSVPIQFFQDGRPASERKVWDSPWGKLGVLTCYDLSYTRIVDDFVRQGAIALLNPTMDVVEWGEHEHRLHARVAPRRAAEYGIPIFRVASSGISQLVTARGRVVASAPFPGAGEIIGGQLPLNAQPRLPLDRWLAPACVGITALALVLSLLPARKRSLA